VENIGVLTLNDIELRQQEMKRQLIGIGVKLDELLELAPTILMLGKLLVRIGKATRQLELNKDSLSQNKSITKYEEFGHRRTFVEIGELVVVKKRRPRR
jgi:hypothetical protein